MSERTVRVRIAVAVQQDGRWHAAGWREATDFVKSEIAQEPLGDCVVHWIEADVPLPSEATIEGEVQGG